MYPVFLPQYAYLGTTALPDYGYWSYTTQYTRNSTQQGPRNARYASQQVPGHVYSTGAQQFAGLRSMRWHKRRSEHVGGVDYHLRGRARETLFQASHIYTMDGREDHEVPLGGQSRHACLDRRPLHDDVLDACYEGQPRYEPFANNFATTGHRDYYRDHKHGPAKEQAAAFDQDPASAPYAKHSYGRAATVDPQQNHAQPQNPKPRGKTQPQSATRRASEADRLRWRVPAGYFLQKWDPDEQPFIVLGSVFDANSLGKWIYDVACYTHGMNKPLANMAKDLWLLIIHLASKVKQAEEVLNNIHIDTQRDVVKDFLESGQRLWNRFRKLIEICEGHMWDAAQRQSGKQESDKNKPIVMDARSGTAFVECLLGRDHELEHTEKLMASIRLFSDRFKVNIEPIIRCSAENVADREEKV